MFPLHDLNPTVRRPVVTLLFIAANLLVWIVLQPHGTVEEEIRFLYEYAVISCEVVRNAPLTVTEVLSGRCLTDPAGPEAFPGKQIGLSVLASMFFHGGLFHLAGNMWFLWIFGNNVEDRFGHFGYLVLYLATGVAGTAAFVLVRPEEVTPLVGASGAVAGVLGAYLATYPRHSVVSLVGWWIIPIPAGIFLAVWFFAQFVVLDVGVAWEAHVGGFLAGMLLAFVLRALIRARPGVMDRPPASGGRLFGRRR